jgi:hypothetical protein
VLAVWPVPGAAAAAHAAEESLATLIVFYEAAHALMTVG